MNDETLPPDDQDSTVTVAPPFWASGTEPPLTPEEKHTERDRGCLFSIYSTITEALHEFDV